MSKQCDRWIHPRRSRLGGAVFCLLLVLTGKAVWAQGGEIPEPSRSSLSELEEAGHQVTCWFVTVPYGAVKAAYAIGGGIAGGLAWVVTGGDMEVAESVWIPSMTGDYIVQPQHLTGQKPLRFLGVSSDAPSS